MDTTACRFALLAALPVGLVAGCGDGGQPTATTSFGVRLPATPAAITKACAKTAARAAFPVLCPGRWPSPGSSRRRVPRPRPLKRASDVYLIDVENGFRRRGGHVFHLLLGGQRRPFERWPSGVDPDLRVTTRRVTIPQRGGGKFVQQLPARRIISARVHGARATVLREPPYPVGGLHGGHVVVLWSDDDHGYLVSLHGERLSQRALVSIALAIARSMRPRGTNQRQWIGELCRDDR